MNVLSIDWDYFIDASIKTRQYYFPDGGNENLSSFLRNIIWAGRYAAYDKMKDIGVLKDKLEEMNEHIKDSTEDYAEVMIRDSHRHIYDFICKKMEEMEEVDEPFNLVNIDFHHDVYELGKGEVHAGNWLKHIMEKVGEKGRYTWIAREDSDVQEAKEHQPNLRVEIEDFKAIWDTQWDLIFICRSDMWSPPHLDDNFSDSFKWMLDEYPAITQIGIFDSRYSQSFVDEVTREIGMKKAVLEKEDEMREEMLGEDK